MKRILLLITTLLLAVLMTATGCSLKTDLTAEKDDTSHKTDRADATEQPFSFNTPATHEPVMPDTVDPDTEIVTVRENAAAEAGELVDAWIAAYAELPGL